MVVDFPLPDDRKPLADGPHRGFDLFQILLEDLCAGMLIAQHLHALLGNGLWEVRSTLPEFVSWFCPNELGDMITTESESHSNNTFYSIQKTKKLDQMASAGFFNPMA